MYFILFPPQNLVIPRVLSETFIMFWKFNLWKYLFIVLAHCSKPTLSNGHLHTFNSNARQQFCTDADDECIAGSIAVFVCDLGYILSGHGYSYCQGRGIWYPPIPVCKGINLLYFYRVTEKLWARYTRAKGKMKY